MLSWGRIFPFLHHVIAFSAGKKSAKIQSPHIRELFFHTEDAAPELNLLFHRELRAHVNSVLSDAQNEVINF